MEHNYNFVDIDFLNDENNKKICEPSLFNLNKFYKEKVNNENFVTIFDQIFNRSNCFSQSCIEEEGEDDKSIELRNNYFFDGFEKNYQKDITNEEEYMKNSTNNMSGIDSLEKQLKKNISSLSEENIIVILKELYNISDNGKLIKYKYNSLLLAKKLIEELKSRINNKIKKMD